MAGYIDTSALIQRYVPRPTSPAFQGAIRSIREGGLPLATLGALHLGSALQYGCTHNATSNKQRARAAQHSGLANHDFSS